MRIVVDPAFFAPHEGLVTHAVDQHIEAARRYRELVRTDAVRLGIISELLEELSSMELLPLRKTIERLFKREGVRHIAAHDFAQLLLGLAEMAEYLDDEVIAIEETRSPMVDVTSSAGQFCACHPEVDMLTIRSWTFSAAFAVRPVKEGLWDAMLTPRPLQHSSMPGNFAFREVLYADEAVVTDIAGEYELPLVANLSDALRTIDPVTIALHEILASRPPVLGVQAFAQQLFGVTLDVEGGAFGVGFVSDLQVEFVTASEPLLRRILRACVEIFTNATPAKSHGLRKTSGGGSPQIASGEYRAWRHDVDHEYHIHYWKGPGGDIELASMKGHNVFVIPDRALQ